MFPFPLRVHFHSTFPFSVFRGVSVVVMMFLWSGTAPLHCPFRCFLTYQVRARGTVFYVLFVFFSIGHIGGRASRSIVASFCHPLDFLLAFYSCTITYDLLRSICIDVIPCALYDDDTREQYSLQQQRIRPVFLIPTQHTHVALWTYDPSPSSLHPAL